MKRAGGSGDLYSTDPVVVEANTRQEKMAVHEAERYEKCKHPNVIGCYGFTVDSDGNWCLLLQFAGMGSLHNFYANFKRGEEGGISF